MNQQFTVFSIATTYNSAKISLLNDLKSLDRTLSDLSLVNVLLYGDPQFADSENAFILNSSIRYYINF